MIGPIGRIASEHPSAGACRLDMVPSRLKRIAAGPEPVTEQSREWWKFTGCSGDRKGYCAAIADTNPVAPAQRGRVPDEARMKRAVDDQHRARLRGEIGRDAAARGNARSLRRPPCRPSCRKTPLGKHVEIAGPGAGVDRLDLLRPPPHAGRPARDRRDTCPHSWQRPAELPSRSCGRRENSRIGAALRVAGVEGQCHAWPGRWCRQ